MDRAAPSTSTDARAAGWIASLILHGTLAFGLFVFVQQVKLAPQTTAFTWNVALVAPGPQATVAPASTAQRSAAPAPAAEPAVKSVLPKTIPDAQPVKPVTPTVETRVPTPSVPQPVEEHVRPVVAEQPPLPRTMDTIERDPGQADLAPHMPAMSAPPVPATSASAGSAPSTLDETVATHKETPSPQPAAVSTEPQVASLGPTGQAKSVKADYGWLADLMAKWIGELDKRYPAMLRTEGITGRVTLTALLHQDGMLTEVRVAKSSGNALLDQVAVEDIQGGPPVKLPRPLDRPSMPVKFSIVYDLKTAR